MAVATSRMRAVVVPDEPYWTAAGFDLRGEGIDPEPDPGAADALVLPPRLPRPLSDAARELRVRLPDPRNVRILDGPELGGEATEPALREAFGAREESEGGAGEGGGGGHDHGDMMAVTGEPSDDGLVMEDAELIVGPVSVALPTGLVARLTLDGDVVCSASVSSALGSAPPPGDPLAPQSFRWAAERIAGGADPSPALVARRLAAVELERAISHVAWLARVLRLVGWIDAAERTARAAAFLPRAQRASLDGSGAVEPVSRTELKELLEPLSSSRRLRRRLEGLAPIAPERCREQGIRGPAARAAGLADDDRTEDPSYRELGFEPVVGRSGDAMGRLRVRIDEVLASLQLAEAALAAGSLPAPGGRVEGPRGPLRPQGAGPAGETAILPEGADPLVAAAAASAEGHELARALVALASFDAGPWQVRG